MAPASKGSTGRWALLDGGTIGNAMDAQQVRVDDRCGGVVPVQLHIQAMLKALRIDPQFRIVDHDNTLPLPTCIRPRR